MPRLQPSPCLIRVSAPLRAQRTRVAAHGVVTPALLCHLIASVGWCRADEVFDVDVGGTLNNVRAMDRSVYVTYTVGLEPRCFLSSSPVTDTTV
jgi:hypothetical protein